MLIVAYDIPNDRRRTKVAKALCRVGHRVQYSVFLVETETVANVAKLLRPLIRKSEDDVRIHPLCMGCHHKSLLLGRAAVPMLPPGFRIV